MRHVVVHVAGGVRLEHTGRAHAPRLLGLAVLGVVLALVVVVHVRRLGRRRRVERAVRQLALLARTRLVDRRKAVDALAARVARIVDGVQREAEALAVARRVVRVAVLAHHAALARVGRVLRAGRAEEQHARIGLAHRHVVKVDAAAVGKLGSPSAA